MKETIKVIFLDVDGVLNSYDWFYSNQKNSNKNNKPIAPLDDKAIHILSKIVNSTNAKIVLSSSWRVKSDDSESMLELREKFNEYGISIFDKTGWSRKRKSRGWEIREWLKENRKLYNITSFVIIDDDSFDIANHKKTLLPY